MKELLKRIRMELEDAPYKHPNVPLVLSVIALAVSILMPLLRSILA